MYIPLHIFDSKITLKVIKINFIAFDSQQIKSSELQTKQAAQALFRAMNDFASYFNFTCCFTIILKAWCRKQVIYLTVTVCFLYSQNVALEGRINYTCVKCGCVLRSVYPRPRTRMWDRSSEGINTLRNSAEKMPPFFMAPDFLMLRVTERRGCRKWNSLSER